MNIKEKRLLVYDVLHLVKEVKEGNVCDDWDLDEVISDLEELLNEYYVLE